jgi:hypothetical protein
MYMGKSPQAVDIYKDGVSQQVIKGVRKEKKKCIVDIRNDAKQ